jgi:hypothetical protein
MAALPQMKLLISLAQIDGKVADRERNYIVNIGRANGLYPDEVEPLFDQRHELIIPTDLTDDQKFDYIFSLIQLMKIDERMYREELMFCGKIATNLGYRSEVLFDLLLHVRSFEMPAQEMADLKAMVQKNLKR